MTNLVLSTYLSLRNVPDGRRDGLGHLTVYSKDYVLEYEGTVKAIGTSLSFLLYFF